MPKARSPKVVDLFSGYQVEEIMRVCVVDEGTAQHYKRGRTPSRQAQRLWWLHIQGRVLGQEWRRFRVRGGSLVVEAGTAFQENEIATIPLLHQRIAELQVQLDKYRYEGAIGQLGVFELPDALKGFIRHGTELLEAVEKIPRRNIQSDGNRANADPTPSRNDCETTPLQTVTRAR